MIIYEYFSYKTFFYFIKGDFEVDFSKFKESCWEDDEGLPAKKYTSDDLERAFENRFSKDEDIIVIKTNFGTFLYHGNNDHEYVKNFLKLISSKNKSCAVFGSYRTTDVYTFGLAENGEVKRYFYSDESTSFDEGTPSQFEKENPFTYLTDPVKKDCKYINESYIFDYAKWFAGFDIETQDVKILDIKFYKPCELDGTIPENVEQRITRNLLTSGTDVVPIFISYNKEYKNVIISASNIINEKTQYTIYFDEVSLLDNYKEILLSFKRCIQAVATFNLSENHKTICPPHLNHTTKPDKTVNTAMVMIDTEKKFLIGVSKFIKKGKRVATSKLYLPNYNMFYDLNDETLEKILKRVARIIK